jgi:hypothetical protein
MTEPNLKSARSFQELVDPMMWKNKFVTIKAVAGFVVQGRDPVKEGEVLKVSKSFASELVSGGKAEIVPEAEPPRRQAESDPNFIPQFDPAGAAAKADAEAARTQAEADAAAAKAKADAEAAPATAGGKKK